MARLPTFRRFNREDFQKAPDWINRLLTPLNEFIRSIVNSYNNQLTLNENLLAEVRTINVKTASSVTSGSGSPAQPNYVELLRAVQVGMNLNFTPVGIVVLNCVDQANSRAINRYGVSVDWSFREGIITINAVSGLEVDKTYAVTLWIVGG